MLPADQITAIRFGCDADRDEIPGVDFFYAQADQASAIYSMFQNAHTDADFQGGGDNADGTHSDAAVANFGSKAVFDIIGQLDFTTWPNPHVEDGDDSPDDFHLGTAAFDTGGCYGRPGMGNAVVNCWGTYDGARNGSPGRASGAPNMCQRLAPPDGQYVPESPGYWYIWVR